MRTHEAGQSITRKVRFTEKPIGIRLSPVEEGLPIRVTAVQTPSQAEESGIRAGYLLLEGNDMPLTTQQSRAFFSDVTPPFTLLFDTQELNGGTFVDYVNEFCALVRDLVARRSVWAEIAPYDDPMRYDETALRELEALVLEDLLGAGASEEQLRAAHCWGELRLQSRPPCRVVETSQCVVAAMKERYERVCGEMCHTPAPPVIAAFQTKLRLLSYLCEQKQKPDYRPLPLDDVHRDLARLRKESDVPRRVTPMGDSEESEEEDTSADSVSDECLDDAGSVPRLVIQKEVNQELMNRRLAYKEKKHGWVLCQSQACGGAVANSISRDSQLIWGNYVSEFGIRCPCHKELFCSIKCLSQHMKIRLPTRPEEGISDQQRSVLDEYRHIKQSLHLFLAYLHRRFGTSRAIISRKGAPQGT